MSESQIPAAEFKAHCLQLLDGVQKSGQSLVVTKRGRPMARVTPSHIAGDDDPPTESWWPPPDWEARPESPLTKSRMGLEAGRHPQIVLESGRLYNIQRRSSLPATELGVFGRTSSASGSHLGSDDKSSLRIRMDDFRGGEPSLG